MRQLTHIVGLAPYSYQMHILRQEVDSLDSQRQVLAALYGSYVQHIALGQLVTLTDSRLALFLDSARIVWRKTLIDDADAVGILLSAQLQNVLPRALTDGNDVVGLAQRLAELPFVYLRVQPVVVLRMAHKNQVVDGDNATNACLAQTHRQLARQTVIDGDTIAHQVTNNAARAPPRLAQRCRVTLRITELGTLDNLSAQVVTPLVRSIQPQLHIAVAQTYQVVDQCAPIAAQPCPVAHNALSVYSNYHTKSSPYLICTSLTYLRTSADESPFLQMSNTLPSSATI